jgi:hypothetical protein
MSGVSRGSCGCMQPCLCTCIYIVFHNENLIREGRRKKCNLLITKEEYFGQSCVFFLGACAHACVHERQEDLDLEKELEGLHVPDPTNWFPWHMCLILYF